jgi:Asp-tRNA(Asn)/Glu-tRNA(Gln) amidotransferase C subunit
MAQLAKEQGRDAEARELALKAEADLVGYLEQLRAGDNMDPRLKPVYAALRDNARLRGDEQEVEFWKNELSMMAHIGGPVLVNISATTS